MHHSFLFKWSRKPFDLGMNSSRISLHYQLFSNIQTILWFVQAIQLAAAKLSEAIQIPHLGVE